MLKLLCQVKDGQRRKPYIRVNLFYSINIGGVVKGYRPSTSRCYYPLEERFLSVLFAPCGLYPYDSLLLIKGHPFNLSLRLDKPFGEQETRGKIFQILGRAEERCQLLAVEHDGEGKLLRYPVFSR